MIIDTISRAPHPNPLLEEREVPFSRRRRARDEVPTPRV